MNSRDKSDDFFFDDWEKLPWIAKRRWENYEKLLSEAKDLVRDRKGWKRTKKDEDVGQSHFTEWGDGLLTVAEHEMLFATATGLYLPAKYEKGRQKKASPIPTDRIDVTRYDLPDPNLHNAERWIGADLLRWLITDKSIADKRDPLGVFFLRSVVVGELNLDHVVEPRLRVAGLRSTFVGTLTARHAHLHALALCGSRMIPSAKTTIQAKLLPKHILNGGIQVDLDLHDQPVIKQFPGASIDEGWQTPDIHRFSPMSLAADSLVLQADCNLTREFVAEGPVDLDRSHVGGSVNFLDSRFKSDSFGSDYVPALSMEAAHIKKDLVMMRTKVIGVTHLHKIRVDGHIGFQGAKLRYKHQTNHAYKQPQLPKKGATRVSSYRAALNLADARVGGSLNFSSAMSRGHCYEYALAESTDRVKNRILHTVVAGGVRMRLARINGDIKLHSAKIFAKKFRSAIDATSAHIKGSVMAQRARNHAMGQTSFVAFGNVRFRAARIGGQVDFTAAKLFKRTIDLRAEKKPGLCKPQKYIPTHAWSLDLRNARIGAQLKMDEDFVAERGVCMRGARITDRVTIEGRPNHNTGEENGCRITAPDPSKHARSLGRAIDAFRVQIGGSFYLDGPNAKVQGKIDFSLARIRGRFGIGRRLRYAGNEDDGYTLDGEYGDRIADIDVTSNKIDENVQGQWLSIKPCVPPVTRGPITTLAELGVISLQHARIDFELIIGPPTMRERAGEQGLLFNNPVLIDGRIDAVHAQIGYQVCLGRATFNHTRHAETPIRKTQANNQNQAGLPGKSERVPGLTQYNAAIDFTGSTIGTDFYVDGSIILGGLCLDSAEIAQDLILRRGLAYSENAALALWPGCDSQNISFDERGVCGENLRNKRHDSKCWALSMRHATVCRTASIRPSFAAFGALTVLRSRIEGYLEFCPTDSEIWDADWKASPTPNPGNKHKPLVNQYEEMCVNKTLSSQNWFVTWLINLSGTHVGVLWWSLQRSGYVDKSDSLETDLAKGSLADLLFINDFTYDNFWFFSKNPSKGKPGLRSTYQLDSADQRLINYVDQADGDKESCRRFLELQTLPTKTLRHRQKRIAIQSRTQSTTLDDLKEQLRKFNPQPFEHMASVSKTHGRSDLFAWCHEQKWKRITYQERPEHILKRTLFRLLVLSLLILGIAFFAHIESVQKWFGTYWGLIVMYGFIFVVLTVHLILVEPSLKSLRTFRFLKPPDRASKPVLWLVLRLFGSTAGYGYKPRKLFIYAMSLLLFGALFSSWGYHLDIIRPSSSLGDRVLSARQVHQSNKPLGQENLVDDNAYSSDYPAFNSFWYAADLLIPVIGLEQAEYWQPFPFKQNSNTYHFYARDKHMPAREMYLYTSRGTGDETFDTVLGWMTYPIYQPLRFWHEVHNDHPNGWIAKASIFFYIFESFYTILGWILVTLGIASATRLIRHE